MKFTLSVDSLSSWDSAIYEDDQEKFSEVPEYIKRLASQAELADYDIGKVLGAGSFGQVVATTRKADNLPVALKFVQKSSVKEFKRINGGEIPSEAYLQRQARHRHVIDIYDVIDTDEHYVYVMERPQVCKDLFDVIHDRDSLGRPLTEREARRYFAQILQADINCEETGVLHRDIRPENILVDMCTDEAKLIDFGLASEMQQKPFTRFRETKNLIYSLLNTTPSNRPTLKQTLQHPWFSLTD